MAKKTVAELHAAAKRRQAKRTKRSKAAISVPTDKEIADQINEIAKFWLTTPGLPGSMTDKSPLWDPLFGSTTTTAVEGVPLMQTPWIPPGTVVPESLRQAIRDFQFPGQTDRRTPLPTRKPPRVRSPKQMVNDEIQSTALRDANVRARTKNGQMKKGWTQKRIMQTAQKECTRERERLGLCKRRSTRKGQPRKTARRAYDTRLDWTRRRR